MIDSRFKSVNAYMIRNMQIVPAVNTTDASMRVAKSNDSYEYPEEGRRSDSAVTVSEAIDLIKYNQCLDNRNSA